MGKNIFGILQHVVRKMLNMWKVLLTITCDKTIFQTKTIPTETSPTKGTLRRFYVLLFFFLAIIALLITVSISFYLIEYRAKEKHLLPCHYIISDLREVGY